VRTVISAIVGGASYVIECLTLATTPMTLGWLAA
jgi:hypothetical protein